MKTDKNGNILELMTGDITKQRTDAIVNAANGSLLGGGGVDGAIHRAAGKELLTECKQIREEQLKDEKLPTGEAVITSGYNLPAKYVIHTVGPVWKEHHDNQEYLLANCYQNSLELAMQQGVSSIAFPSISTGVYRFPVSLAAKTALKTIIEFLKSYNFGSVVMVLFSEQDYATYEAVLKEKAE
ncbi:O-acetyl-ADP-ribose deacetylase (regulator of RNase III), contains Macro domain [Lentibacillus halodurans]|uniref:O-acetyl-ADP-ribose deacetylase (Regulator of RNase III), contains Macro domain n=1 Tax=Lentibacillus halodurans TaxID=237679 RepID=A0A1I1A1C4_9BACI|nr:O-acetyl-ADP-ribose deacetylase [Lentibacillus halodurans]SFB30378.1 O-acetyl-ADP-ribose deacetylase (regulator of RNase III), contains Macro domain [Lentibacillus halodurans]